MKEVLFQMNEICAELLLLGVKLRLMAVIFIENIIIIQNGIKWCLIL